MSEPRTPAAQYLKALFEAQKKVRPALKKAQHPNYKYAPSQEIVDAAKEALHNAGLMVTPAPVDNGADSSSTYLPLDGGGEKNGGATGKLKVRYRVVHVDTGYAELFTSELPVVPTPSKSFGWQQAADKATLASETELRGYFMLALLMIPRRDVKDVSGRREDNGNDDGGKGVPARGDFPRLTVGDAVEKMRATDKMPDLAQTLQLARAHLKQHPEEGEGAAEKLEGEFTTAAVRILDGYKSKAQAQKAEALIGRVTEGRKLREDNRRAIDEALARAKECP